VRAERAERKQAAHTKADDNETTAKKSDKEKGKKKKAGVA
jgi:hypothetical protein